MAELVGILNLTPDSFSDGGNFFKPYYQPEKAVAYAEQLFEEGAAIVDIGAESTRPGAIPIIPHTEWWRLERVVEPLVEKYPGKVSVDTRHHEIARQALELSGDIIINDVTGLNDPRMLDVVAEYGARCIVSHLHGTDIQAIHNKKHPHINDPEVVISDLRSKHALLVDAGIDPGSIILDPGLGFGKTAELSAELVEIAAELPGYQVMIGASRKRFLERSYAMPDEDRKEDLEPSLRAGQAALNSGAAYLRVHDVEGHRLNLIY